MARPQPFLKIILTLFNKRAMTRQDILRRTKKSRKTVWQNLRTAQKEGLAYQDGLERYHLTTLGKLEINYVEKPTDKTSWQIRSKVIDDIGWRSNKPTATCTLMLKD